MKVVFGGILLLLGLSSNVFAQSQWSDVQEIAFEANTLPKVKGLVRRINVAANSMTIKAGAIPNLNMPPMTMDFIVQDSSVLGSLAAGDHILFSADEINGDLMIVWLEKQQ